MRFGSVEFQEALVVDFEFVAVPGEQPKLVCLVAHELVSGRIHRLFGTDLLRNAPPYPTGKDSLFIAYYASAEVGCHLALSWPIPACILDLYAEFRNETNGLPVPCGNGLIGALVYFGEDVMSAREKDAMRQLILRGDGWTECEQRDILNYCEADVVAVRKLLFRMLPRLDLPRALMRGQYMAAAAQMEARGVPIDTNALSTLRACWPKIQEALIRRIDGNYGIFEGRTFKADRFAGWLVSRGIPWPQLASGALALDDDTFRQMGRCYPAVAPLRELRVSLSQMRLEDLAVGSDGRNRTLLSAFGARTGRNSPGSTKYIFGPAVWLRGLIRPEPGTGLAYVDFAQQEFGIAAALSRDPAMIAAYESGDPYLAFAKAAGALPLNATKQTDGAIREQFKACALGVQYSMGAEALATRIGQPAARGLELLCMHREAYRQFWRWSDAVVDYGMLKCELHTVFGWLLHVRPETNPRSLRNFPMQANGSEMLRHACCLALKRGIRVCAPIHDALLIEAPLSDLDAAVTTTQQVMSDASALVLNGFRLRSDAKAVRYPDRYADERGRQMWNTVWALVSELAVGETGRVEVLL